MSIDVGQPAPDFTLPTAGGGEVSLSGLRGSPVVVYFYPKADTPGCTKEACGFSEALPDFSGARATEKSMYGKKYMGIDRSTFLIGEDGTIRAVWRGVKVPGHVDAVKQALRGG